MTKGPFSHFNLISKLFINDGDTCGCPQSTPYHIVGNVTEPRGMRFALPHQKLAVIVLILTEWRRARGKLAMHCFAALAEPQIQLQPAMREQ